jgi:hypothetical protein
MEKIAMGKGHTQDHPFKQRDRDDAAKVMASQVHVFGDHVVCDTDSRGYPTPENRDPLDLVLDASEGFIPLWAKDVTLRWRFQARSLDVFVDPESAAAGIRQLLGEAMLAWGEAAPIRFTQRDDAWDFEIAVSAVDDCSPNGCVLASAFFPDAGRHELTIYPRMFTQSHKEQIDTLTHEIGYTFGLSRRRRTLRIEPECHCADTDSPYFRTCGIPMVEVIDESDV